MVVHHDERGAGFAAVGYARAVGRAAVVLTTSGTAVANLLPAVVEAAQVRMNVEIESSLEIMDFWGLFFFGANVPHFYGRPTIPPPGGITAGVADG